MSNLNQEEITQFTVLQAISLNNRIGLSLHDLGIGFRFRDLDHRNDTYMTICSIIEELLEKGLTARLYDPISKCFIGLYRTKITETGRLALATLRS